MWVGHRAPLGLTACSWYTAATQDRHGEKHVSCRSLPSPTDCEVEETVPGVQLFYKPRAPTPTGPRALTVPVAPKLHTDSRAGRKPPSPRGPQEEGFQPEQSHHKGPAGGLALREYLAPSAPVPAPKPPSPRGLTVPQSPHLSTGQRAAARRPLQQAAQAAVEAAVAVAAQFKARPVDHRVLHSNGEMGVPKVCLSWIRGWGERWGRVYVCDDLVVSCASFPFFPCKRG